MRTAKIPCTIEVRTKAGVEQSEILAPLCDPDPYQSRHTNPPKHWRTKLHVLKIHGKHQHSALKDIKSKRERESAAYTLEKRPKGSPKNKPRVRPISLPCSDQEYTQSSGDRGPPTRQVPHEVDSQTYVRLARWATWRRDRILQPQREKSMLWALLTDFFIDWNIGHRRVHRAARGLNLHQYRASLSSSQTWLICRQRHVADLSKERVHIAVRADDQSHWRLHDDHQC